MVSVGDTAPPFDLRGVGPDGGIGRYTLEELTDDSALVFGVYVFDFSPVCVTQMCDVSQMDWLSFQENLNVVGVSTDGPYSHQRFMKDKGISYPLLCDTSGEVINSYGVMHEEKDGFKRLAKRSMFLIDSEQKIQYRWIAKDNWDEWGNGPLLEIQERLEAING